MKRIFRAVSILFLVILMVGCKNTGDNTIPQMTSQIEKIVKITSGDEAYECRVCHTPEGTTTINFISPKNLEGFTISESGEKYGVAQGELQGEYSKHPIMENSAIKYLIDVLDNLGSAERNFKYKNTEEGERSYVGTLSGKECEVVLNNKSEIIKVIVKDLGIKIDFI